MAAQIQEKKNWLGSLFGKSKMPKIPEHLMGEGKDAGQENQPVQNVQAPGGFGFVASQVARRVSDEAQKPVGSKFPKGHKLPKIVAEMSIGAFILLLVVGTLIFFVTRKVVSPPDDGGVAKVTPTKTVEPTEEPTPPIYIPGKASPYAEDEEVLKIEEDISVLERETATVNLREVGLQPPLLDFSVKF